MNNMKYPSIIFFMFLIFSCDNQEIKYLNSDLSYEERLDDLMSRMTLEEKVGQMCQYVGLNYLSQSPKNMTAEEILNSDSQASYKGFKKKDIAQMVVDGKIGSFLHVLTPEEANRLQGLALKSRLKIPLLIGIDAIHGNGMVRGSTIYPSPITIASTFDDQFAFDVGRQTALEMRATGSHWAFTPNIDVLRDPRWGRVGETFGEDPKLVSNMGVKMISGLQLEDYTGNNKVIACAKHFVAGSEPINGLNVSPMDISERTLREIYLKPFKAAVNSGVYTIMAAHNEINGIPAHMHKNLMTGVLKKEFGFDGFFISDWLDIERIHTLHNIAKDLKEASYLSVDAGMDMHMHGPYFLEAVVELVNEGKLSIDRVDYAASKILMAKFKLGLFENSLVDLDDVINKIQIKEHIEKSLEIARKSIVLLKNDGTLPIRDFKKKRILVTGPNANNHAILGDWTKPQPKENVITIFEGIKTIGSEKGHTVDYFDSNQNIRKISDDDIITTSRKASGYDHVIVVVGDNSLRHLRKNKTAGENMGRSALDLAGRQLELLKEIHRFNKNITVVFVNGKPIAEPWIKDNIKSIVESWEPGQMGGLAVAEVLFGEVNPSGKLPLTFPRSVGQLQMIYNHKPSQYFHKYAFEKTAPLYHFGHGLSYSKFNYSNFELINDEKNKKILISVDVSNTSDIDGDEVVQLYFRDKYSSVTRPVKELVAYKRQLIESKSSTVIDFQIDYEDLAFYDREMNYCVEPGEFTFMVGGSSQDSKLLKNEIKINKRYEY